MLAEAALGGVKAGVAKAGGPGRRDVGDVDHSAGRGGGVLTMLIILDHSCDQQRWSFSRSSLL